MNTKNQTPLTHDEIKMIWKEACVPNYLAEPRDYEEDDPDCAYSPDYVCLDNLRKWMSCSMIEAYEKTCHIPLSELPPTHNWEHPLGIADPDGDYPPFDDWLTPWKIMDDVDADFGFMWEDWNSHDDADEGDTTMVEVWEWLQAWQAIK